MKKKPVLVPTTLQTPVFAKVRHELRTVPDLIMPGAKAKKPALFSKSRDNREDRGERMMKTTHNPQTNHGR